MERSKIAVTSAIIFLVIWHQVGVVGLHVEESRALFQQLVPLNLLLSVGLLAWFHKIWNMQFGLLVFGVFWGGYIIELIGVHTGVIFGSYYYGNALGPLIGDVPPMIGVNWLMLVYITGIISQKISSHIWARVLLGASLMVLLDLLIEPVAISHDFWYWRGGGVPLHNYFGWFIIASIMQFGFHRLHQEKTNPIAYPLFLIQLAFFATFIVVDWASM